MKKATKKVAKKEPKYTMPDWMENIEDMIEYDHCHSEDLCQRINRLRIAVWSLVIFDVVMTASLLILLYGNQYLVK